MICVKMIQDIKSHPSYTELGLGLTIFTQFISIVMTQGHMKDKYMKPNKVRDVFVDIPYKYQTSDVGRHNFEPIIINQRNARGIWEQASTYPKRTPDP